MPCVALYFALITVYSSKNVHSDYLPIKWNDSTDVGHSNERLYEHPMFTDVAPAACDLTADACDPSCCVDPDCDDEQIKTFNCSAEVIPCSRPFARYDCNCNVDNPSWFPVLCYVFENPIYLGLFYKTRAKIDNVKDFLGSTSSGRNKYRPAVRVTREKRYVFGTNILAYALQNGSYTPQPHGLLHENNMMAGFSLDCHIPVKYMKNEENSCYVGLTQENCEDSTFGAKSYLLRNENSTDMQDVPVVLKNLQSEQIADVSVTFKYLSTNYVTHNFKGDLNKYFYSNGETFDSSYNSGLFQTFWNDSICHNVVVRAIYKFITNASEIQKVDVQIELTNISVPSDNENVYLKKIHDVSFVDVSDGSESDSDSYLFNRGYYIGENLNFGYIRKNGSHLNWEKGKLQIFFNGGLCNRTTDVTFGYNTFSVCLHPIRTSDCSQVRKDITSKMESLALGDHLAPYSSYRNPAHPAVPLLRNYMEWTGNGTDCVIPVQQDIYIQYTTGITPKGFTVYQAIGAMMNRTYANLTDEDAITLFINVVFVDITQSTKKPLSRFWEKITSREGSDNAWLNIFNVYDRSVADEEVEESSFWFVLPVIIACGSCLFLRDFR